MRPNYINSVVAACAIYELIDGGITDRSHGAVVQLRDLPLGDLDDEGIIDDLRRLNGRPANQLFDVFWAELDMMLEENAQVQERRHGDEVSFMPFAVPVEHLIRKVQGRLEIKYQAMGGLLANNVEIPSRQWTSMQFAPKNSGFLHSLAYTGELDICAHLPARQSSSATEES